MAPPISDPRIAPALRLMHRDPGRPCGQGARQGGRDVPHDLRVAFKAVAGIAPLAYLTEWRMRLPRSLCATRTPPSPRSRAHLAYTSESAFSNAFRRATAGPPRHYRNERGADARLPTMGLSVENIIRFRWLVGMRPAAADLPFERRSPALFQTRSRSVHNASR